jgi:hypothetical protein
MRRWKQFLWSGFDKSGHLTLHGLILKRKAEEIAMKLGAEFRPSNDWIDRFKKYSGLVYKKVCGEAKCNSKRSGTLERHNSSASRGEVFSQGHL